MGDIERGDVLRFAEFVLDLRAGELRKEGWTRPVTLPEQPLRTLRALLKRPGEMVSREELIQGLWPGGGYGDFEHGLNKVVNKLRDILEDSKEKPKFIETVARRGYRFVAPVKEVNAPAAGSAHLETTAKSIEGLDGESGARQLGFSLRTVFAYSVGITLVGVVGYTTNKIQSITEKGGVSYTRYTSTKLAQQGETKLVAISPDGKFLATIVQEPGQQSLWLRNVHTNTSNLVLGPQRAMTYKAVRFSPDGNYVYFVRIEGEEQKSQLYRLPVLGDPQPRLVTGTDGDISFSPDGKRFVSVIADKPSPGESSLRFYSLESGEDQVLALPITDNVLTEPAWSPDGKFVVCARYKMESNSSSLVSINLGTGKQTRLFESNPAFVRKPIWLPDGRSLFSLVIDAESNFTRYRLIEISFPGGKPRDVTQDVNYYNDLSLTMDGRTLATVVVQNHYDVFAVSAADPSKGPIEQLTSGAPFYQFSWAPQRRLILSQDWNLNLYDVGSHVKTPLTSMKEDGFATFPSVCSDGRYVVFSLERYRGNRTHDIWRMDPQGGNLRRLTNSIGAYSPLCSRDSRSVFYAEGSPAGVELRKIDVDGGSSEVLTGFSADGFLSALSPDGKIAAFVYSPESKLLIALVSVDSPHDKKLVNFGRSPTVNPGMPGEVQFTPDGTALVYSFRDRNGDNLWLQPLDGSPGRQITNFDSEYIVDFHWTLDGNRLGLIRGHTDADIVLLRDIEAAARIE
jgi:Tol biopolymer transport system component/DNA-binding winged helix-turn-helix (wHTH) protein